MLQSTFVQRGSKLRAAARAAAEHLGHELLGADRGVRHRVVLAAPKATKASGVFRGTVARPITRSAVRGHGTHAHHLADRRRSRSSRMRRGYDRLCDGTNRGRRRRRRSPVLRTLLLTGSARQAQRQQQGNVRAQAHRLLQSLLGSRVARTMAVRRRFERSCRVVRIPRSYVNLPTPAAKGSFVHGLNAGSSSERASRAHSARFQAGTGVSQPARGTKGERSTRCILWR